MIVRLPLVELRVLKVANYQRNLKSRRDKAYEDKAKAHDMNQFKTLRAVKQEQEIAALKLKVENLEEQRDLSLEKINNLQHDIEALQDAILEIARKLKVQN